MLNAMFLKRLAEQAVVSFLLAFGAVYTAADGGLSKSAAAAGLAAGLRALYGVFASTVGDSEQPSVK